ncbi:DUF6683 family protein [Deinococcus cellulosilyticus]|uniref:Uncharacterized protein n=1 Tax=Deinococcus cellulosilyticus (strain DSM 18568 / NBRC 106333 / KACC 11606 / 5516J-15) TaxID=1223518 RepID=A0A511MWP0_DEIC1|nr:DUF6683 family protein [Deinococcus cellulosilyticus]GEM44536.1 hypothetical protein DC3_01710 [Deinococcus cellulosilyticus NBRC 106333 = KACC 11606]
MKRFKKAITAGLVLLGMWSVAQAQFAGGLGGKINNPIGATQGQSVLNNLNRDSLFGRQGQTEITRPANTAVTTEPKTENPQLTSQVTRKDAGFTPGPHIYPQKLAATLDPSMVDQQQAADIFEQLLQVYDEQVASQDARLKNNVVGAMVYSTYVSYYILTGIELTEPQQEGLFAALNRTLLAEPNFTSLDDTTRQEMYEALVITASTALGTYSNSATDASQLDTAEMLSEYLIQTIFQHSAEELQFTDDGVQLIEASYM